jgi:DTW domain-containing protein YfiP
LIIRHEIEAQKSTGTARIAQLVLQQVQVLPHTAHPEALTLQMRDTWLLYPGAPQAVNLEQSPPARLIVIDGTWAQSRKILKRTPGLADLPWFSLPKNVQPRVRLRNAPNAESRSTLEAIADALLLIEGASIADPLHQAHDLYVERVFASRGVKRSAS